MHIFNSKYFIILFSLTSMMIYSHDRDQQEKIQNEQAEEFYGRPINTQPEVSEFDILWNYKNAMLDCVANGIKRVTNRSVEMMDAVNQDAQGLKYGFACAMVNFGILTSMSKHPRAQIAMAVACPLIFVSSWIAERNLIIRDFAYNFKQLLKKAKKLNIENDQLRQGNNTLQTAALASQEEIARLKVELERSGELLRQSSSHSKAD